jgi:hypothetical protein
LQRLDELDARLRKLAENRDRAAVALDATPAPRRRLIGRAADPNYLDRHRLHSTILSADDQLARLTTERATLTRELGDPEQIRSELDALNRTIKPLTQQHRTILHELAEQELANPAPWVTHTFGERPTGWLAEHWDRAVLRAGEYRFDHDITDPDTPLGPPPAGGRELRHWEQAQQTIEHGQHTLGRDHDRALDIEIGH